ncbi:MAG: hypothetical protein DSM106950_02815 [Stigonema ocellatum SAG 48.90 = DSM 106950]|nr:hypothetical protein [Stigonema ocellatum SAG 48.90 = DSM 106950]
MMVKAVQDKLPVNTHYINESQLIREVRIGFYRHDPNFINKQIEEYHKYGNSKNKISINKIFEQICNNPFDSDWFGTLPQGL